MFTVVLDTLAAVSPDDRTRGELEALIGELDRVESAVVERRLACTAALNRLAAVDGGLDGADVVRVKAKRSARAAKRDAAMADVLADMPRTRAALASGEINAEHAAAAVSAAERVTPEQADGLVCEARSRPADLFARQARSWATAREREEAKEARAQRQRVAREVSWWTDTDGMWNLFAKLDPHTGREVQKALNKTVDGLWRDDGGRDGRPDEVRTPPQRKADAFAQLITVGSNPTTGTTRRPHPKHLIAIRADHTRLRPDDPAGVAEYVDGAPIPQATLEQLVCDAALIGFVYDQHGETLYQGRSTRLATDAQWANLIARDGTCFCCGTPPEHCTAHHITPWAPPARGPTDLDHLVLVCNRTHTLIHHHGHQPIRGPDGTWTLHPPTATTNRTNHAA